MRKWRILLTVNGVRTETVISAPSQLQALMIAKTMFPQASAFNAIEIH